MQDFLKILVTQLGNQDPLKPMDNQEFVTQLAQFTSLQQTQEMNDKLASLLSVQASAQSVGLLGKTVDLETAAGPSTGTVSAIGFAAGEPRLTVRTSAGAILADITLASLTSVR
ncbi:flagellar hook assembly protein FlgD [Roseateles microcysteis]|uniref:flagellar hook assembly protein FlgD n=1 Tax=Roseateles microcysteis TaxID=3119057 RepID=UPI002FE5C7F6